MVIKTYVFFPSNSQVVSAVLSSQVGNRQTTGVSADTLELNPISLTFNSISVCCYCCYYACCYFLFTIVLCQQTLLYSCMQVNETIELRCAYWNFSDP